MQQVCEQSVRPNHTKCLSVFIPRYKLRFELPRCSGKASELQLWSCRSRLGPEQVGKVSVTRRFSGEHLDIAGKIGKELPTESESPYHIIIIRLYFISF